MSGNPAGPAAKITPKMSEGNIRFQMWAAPRDWDQMIERHVGLNHTLPANVAAPIIADCNLDAVNGLMRNIGDASPASVGRRQGELTNSWVDSIFLPSRRQNRFALVRIANRCLRKSLQAIRWVGLISKFPGRIACGSKCIIGSQSFSVRGERARSVFRISPIASLLGCLACLKNLRAKFRITVVPRSLALSARSHEPFVIFVIPLLVMLWIIGTAHD